MTKTEINPLFKDGLPKLIDMSKTIGAFKMPTMDMNAIIEMQRKNIEAITTINQSILENVQSFLGRQAELLRKGMQELGGMVSVSTTPQENVVQHAQSSKAAIDQCFANVRDASETMAKCNGLVMQTVSDRMSEGLDELRELMKIDIAA
jgi:phasin family protein